MNREVQGWLEMLVGAGICVYTATRGREGVFAKLRSRGEGLMGGMLLAIGIQTHLERLNTELPFFRWLPLALGVLGVALMLAGKVGEIPDGPGA